MLIQYYSLLIRYNATTKGSPAATEPGLHILLCPKNGNGLGLGRWCHGAPVHHLKALVTV